MENLKEKFQRTGIRVNHLADKTGIHRSRISRILNGKEVNVSQKVLDKIEAYLDSVKTD